MLHSLTIVCGNAGAGKTTYGRALAEKSRATYLDLDTVSERLVRIGLSACGLDPNDRDSERYKGLYRDAVHETLFDIAKDNLPHVSCVIVAPFTRERRLADWPERLRARLGVVPRIIVLFCEEPERRRRIVERANPRDAAKLDDWQDYAAVGDDSAHSGTSRPPFEHEWLDTTHQSR